MRRILESTPFWIAVPAVASLLSTTGSGAVSSEADEILEHQPAEFVERLLEKKVVVLKELSARPESEEFFLAYVIFEAPPARAYALLADTARHIEFRPELKGISTVSTHPRGNTDEHRLKVLFLDATYWVRYEKRPEERKLRWALDPAYPNRLKRTEGFWELYEMGADRTLGRFGAMIDVGPALPQFFQKWVTRKNLPRTIERARRWVDSDGSYRP